MRDMVDTKVLASGYVALAVADAALAGSERVAAKRLRFLTKPALMPLLATATRQAGGNRRTTAAHVLSWAGDVALLGSSDRAFVGGLGSFLGAHLAYLSALAPQGERVTARPNGGVRAALGLWAAAAPAMVLAARRQDKELTVPVAAYATALSALLASSARLRPDLSERGRRATQAGAALFLVSDALLGAQTFVLRKHSPILERAVMATYTAGQGLLAAGATQLQAAPPTATTS
jgi:uncharacterized membrane protein YhhN